MTPKSMKSHRWHRAIEGIPRPVGWPTWPKVAQASAALGSCHSPSSPACRKKPQVTSLFWWRPKSYSFWVCNSSETSPQVGKTLKAPTNYLAFQPRFGFFWISTRTWFFRNWNFAGIPGLLFPLCSFRAVVSSTGAVFGTFLWHIQQLIERYRNIIKSLEVH